MTLQNIQDHLQALCDETELSDLLIEDCIDAILWFGCNPISVASTPDGTIAVYLRDSMLDEYRFTLYPKTSAIDYLAITRSVA